jgi:hypothetical protein
MDEIILSLGLVLFVGSVLVFLAGWSLYYKATVSGLRKAADRQLIRSEELQERSAQLLERQERFLDRVEKLLQTVEDRFRP